jgi:hypothetical protein
MENEQPIITIDNKPYKQNELDNNQLGLVNKLAQIQQNKNSLLSQIADLDILSNAWLEKLKESLQPKEEEK